MALVVNDLASTPHKGASPGLTKGARCLYPPPTAITFRPEFFRLPRSGERDPHFGLTRSFYYAAEADSQLKLVRLRKRGNQRGVTLIPYAAVVALFNEAHATCAEVPGANGHNQVESKLASARD